MAARSGGGGGVGNVIGNGNVDSMLLINGHNGGGGGSDHLYDNNDDDEEGGGGGTDETLSPLLLPEGKGIHDISNWKKKKLLFNNNSSNGNNNNSTASMNNKQLWKERFMCLPDQYEAFLTEAQIRFDIARQMWGDRLEDVTRTLQKRNSTDGGTSGTSATATNGGVDGGGGGNEYTTLGSEGDDHGQLLTTTAMTTTSAAAAPLSQAIQTVASNATTQLQSKLVLPTRPDPFRVLLQLFAYEDVWSNHRLDMAFASDTTNAMASIGGIGGGGDGDASSEAFIKNNTNNKNGLLGGGSADLAFYAPQLLSFLLHGAFFDISSKLEEWILKKCGEDLHFAHRCFWFLRSWCLGAGGDGGNKQPGHTRSRSSSSLGGNGMGHGRNLSNGSFGGGGGIGGFMSYTGDHSLDLGMQYSSSASQYGLAMNQLKGVETNLYLSYSQRLISQARHQSSPLLAEKTLSTIDFTGSPMTGGNVVWETYSLVPPNGGGADGLTRESTTSKFSPDEQVLIEQLLHRVVERGSRPATVAQYGSIDGSYPGDVESSGNAGFSFSPSALATAVEEGLVPIDPRTGFHSAAHLDSITSPQKFGFLPLSNAGEPYQQQRQLQDASSLFFAAPMFLDALLSVADDLMDTIKANRTVELQRRLRSLEVELLPSNVIYLPIRNMNHRVWRMVPEESIALSTVERVPCIVCLEVIDYDNLPNAPKQRQSNLSEDRTIISEWVNNKRPSQRHNSIMDKVATYTQEGLRRLEDTIDHLSHHGDKRAGLDRRISDFLNGRGDSQKRNSPLDVVDDIDENDSIEGDEEAPAKITPTKSQKGKSMPKLENLDDGMFLEMCPPPPLGSPRSSHDEREDEEAVNVSSPPISRENSLDNGSDHQQFDPLEAPKTPTAPITDSDDTQQSPMGQWSTPTSFRKQSLKFRKRNMHAIEDIDEEEYSSDVSPQAKQRKRVMFPPPSNSMTRSESVGDQPRMLGPVAPEDTDPVVLKSAAPTVVFKEDWMAKTERLRKKSVHGSHPGWRLLPILIKSNDDLRQEQLASQLIQRMALILAKANVPVWLFPYEIVALTGRGGSELLLQLSIRSYSF